MDEAFGWTVYLSISAAVAFYVAGYVTRVAFGAKTSKGLACSGSCGAGPADRETACLSEVGPPCETGRVSDGAADGELTAEPAAVCGGTPTNGRLEPEPGGATEHAACDSMTSSSWPPEREVSQPPLSCPDRSVQAEPTGPAEGDDRTWAPEVTRPSCSSNDVGGTAGEAEELLGMRRALRRLAQRQRELEARVETALQRAATPASLPCSVREERAGTLLEDLPRDVEAAVVTGALGIPLQQAGPSRVSTELAASLGPIRRMASEVGRLVAFTSPVRRIQVEDQQGVRVDCWLLDPNEDPFGVVLLRLPGPPDELEAPMQRLAADLGLSDTPAYGHPVRSSSAS